MLTYSGVERRKRTMSIYVTPDDWLMFLGIGVTLVTFWLTLLHKR